MQTATGIPVACVLPLLLPPPIHREALLDFDQWSSNYQANIFRSQSPTHRETLLDL